MHLTAILLTFLREAAMQASYGDWEPITVAGATRKTEAAMQDDVIKVARKVSAMLWPADGYDVWPTIGEADRILACNIARAIIPMVQAATLELTAEALRARQKGYADPWMLAADWLQQRAKDLRGPTNEQ